MGRLWLETHEYAFLPPKSAKIRLSSSNSSSLAVPSSSWRPVMRHEPHVCRYAAQAAARLRTSKLGQPWRSARVGPPACRVCLQRPAGWPAAHASTDLHGAGCWQRWQRCSAGGAGGRAHGVGGASRFSARWPLKLHDTSPNADGPRALGARASAGQGVRIENLLAPRGRSLRSKQKYSIARMFITLAIMLEVY